MRKLMVAGNWKMNKTNSEAVEFVSALIPELKEIQQIDRVIFPPFVAIPALSKLLEGTSIGLGAQNMHWKESGAYTGEVSSKMLKEFCDYVIIGHSERRKYFGETDEIVNWKLKAALAHNLIPIMCVGETLEENEAGETIEVITRQVTGGLNGLAPEEMNTVIIAYEPVWAIGTGKTATPEVANEIHGNVIRPIIREMFGGEVAENLRILYGGSVKPSNAYELFRQKDIDGGLVGGASLKVDEFVKIAAAARELAE